MIISPGSIDEINGKGQPLRLLEIDSDLYINSCKYNKYSMNPIPFEFFKLNQDISSYSNSGPFMGMSINKTCNLFHGLKAFIKRSHKCDMFGGYLKDSSDSNYIYYINNKSYTSDSSIIYKIDKNKMKVISKVSVNNSISFAGQDSQYIYIYNLNTHSADIGGIYIYDKLNNTVELKEKQSIFSYDNLSDANYYSGFTYMDNSKNTEVHIINTIGFHNSKINNHIYSIIAKSGNTISNNLGTIYNNTESDDKSIQDFNNVNFHVKGYTRFTKFSDTQIFIPFFSYRTNDLEYHGNISKISLKFLEILKDEFSSSCSFNKEYNIDISEYCESNPDFKPIFLKIMDNLYNRNLDLNIEYITINNKKYMVIMITNVSNNSTLSYLSGIMLLDIDIDKIKLISYSNNKYNYSWDSHITSSDLKIIYQGTYNEGITIYKLNEENLSYETIAFKNIPYLIEIGLDASETLYTLNKSGQIKRLTSFDTMIVDIKLEKNNYDASSGNIETFVIVNTKNMKGEIVKNLIQLEEITGNAQFSNNKQVIEVTGGENIKVPITITKSGKIRVEGNEGGN